jgi:hypothetical protein
MGEPVSGLPRKGPPITSLQRLSTPSLLAIGEQVETGSVCVPWRRLPARPWGQVAS